MSKRACFLLFTGWAAAALVNIPCAEAQLAPAALTLPARFSYAAKFVCGLSSASPNLRPPQEPGVKPGNYATIINIHNPWQVDVQLLKKVVMAAPERFPNTQVIAPSKRFPDRLQSDHALSVDCTEIVNLLTLSGIAIPASVTFIEGFVVIDSSFPSSPTGTDTSADVDVVSVTTTAGSATSTVNSHEVTTVPGRKLPAGTWPF